MFKFNVQTGRTKWVNETKAKAETVLISHRITHVQQYSNAWLIKCGCGEVFTGKGHSYPMAVRKHLADTVVEVPNA